MPTVFLVDCSLSMCRIVPTPDSTEEYSRLNLAIHGLNTLLDHIAVNSKLEFIALMSFSSLFEVVSPFTRDINSLKSKLQSLEEYDKTCFEPALSGLASLVVGEWGPTIPCQVVIVTDGSVGIGPHSLKKVLAHREAVNPFPFPLPYPFSTKLSIMVITSPDDPQLNTSLPLYRQLVELAGGDGEVYIPEGGLSLKSIQNAFQQLAETNFSSFQGSLVCGDLKSIITLHPPPQSYSRIRDFETIRQTVSNSISICGFLNVNEVANPPAFSRHLVLPVPVSGKGPQVPDPPDPGIKTDPDSEDEAGLEEGRTASFCVLLHGALKVENMVALCHVNDDWYGMLYSWADSKKKSSLMLSLFEPGSTVIPWLGDLKNMSPKSLTVYCLPNAPPPFPVRPRKKQSYSQTCVCWIRKENYVADGNKLQRHARKLPEKTAQFYKEVNRIRRHGLVVGFFELLEYVAKVLERECTFLPGTAHPDCALQLTHVANVLRKPQARDLKFATTPLKTKFSHSS